MPQPKPSVIFDTLRHNVRHVNDGMSPTLFSTPYAPEFNRTEYWNYSTLCDLYKNHLSIDTISSTLGHAINFATSVIPKNNNKSGETFRDLYNGHIKYIANNFTINNRQYKNTSDAHLTRFACWALLQEYPELIFSHLYLIMPDADYKTLYAAAYKFSRIYWRSIVARNERTISGIVNRHHGRQAICNHISRGAFFDNKHPQDIKDTYDIPQIENDPLRNYMCTDSLVTYSHALESAIYQYDTSNNKTLDTLLSALRSKLIYARAKLIQKTGHAPEQDISPIPVSQIQSEYKKMERAFIRQYHTQTL